MIVRWLFLITTGFVTIHSTAQNLVVNPGAEGSPNGTGWTIVNVGASCAAGTAASTSNNWTMVPDNSGNYPFAHGGTKTFMAGCSPTAGSSFESYQDIDVTPHATQIDSSNVAFVFTGYMQTPISGQGDAGRFTVDYMNAANVVLGTSYTVSQSNAAGSGATWRSYTNTRTAPVGTRKVRIRLTATVVVTPAINAYFDDISLAISYLIPLPVTYLSFNAKQATDRVTLTWEVADAANFERFEVEQTTDLQHFSTIGELPYKPGTTIYNYIDNTPANEPIRYYRLKITDAVGKISYSRTITVKGIQTTNLVLTPNPATTKLVIKGLNGTGTITISSITGFQMQQIAIRGSSLETSVSHLPSGTYLVTYRNNEGSFTGKLLVK